MLTKSCEKVANIFSCFICDYNTSRKSSYDKHVLSTKHQYLTKSNNLLTKSCKKLQIVANSCDFVCQNCNKVYKSRVGLWQHKKKCTITEDSNKETIPHNLIEEPTDKQMIMLLIKDNSELKNMMMEVLKNGTHNTTNSHNKSFNLQLFLNETCKGAMNIMDFVDSINLQLSDLEKVGKLGYVDGISNIIVKNLKALDVSERPIHCTDKKREILYVKDDNKWEKEDETNNKMRKAIKIISNKNIKMLTTFKEKYPDCLKSESKYSDQYNKIVIESFGGNGDNHNEKENKIIQQIAKEVTIDKE